jgi:hypothetical protein
MKKTMCILLMMVCAGMVFAQAKTASPPATRPAIRVAAPEPDTENAIGIDLFPLFKGIIAGDSENKSSYYCIVAGYEHLIAPHLSIGANISYYIIDFNKDLSGNYFSLTGELRVYSDSESIGEFFFGTAVGFNMFSVDGKSDKDAGGFIGLLASLKTGYKLITESGFFIEPSLSYVLSKYSEWSDVPPLGLEGGFRLGFAF